MSEPTVITDPLDLKVGQRIRHKDTGIEWDLAEATSVFVAEFDSRLAWRLASPTGRRDVIACHAALTTGTWLLVEVENPRWLSLNCNGCGHWEKGQFTKEQVAEWLRVHRFGGIGANEGHTITASTCPHPCGTPAPSDGEPTP